MIRYNVYFKPYNWEVEVYVLLNRVDTEIIIDHLSCTYNHHLDDIIENLTTRTNSGFIKTINRKSIIVINNPINMQEFINIYNHEKNHLEMHICENFHINPHSEEAAELSGNLAKCLFTALIYEFVQYTTAKYN